MRLFVLHLRTFTYLHCKALFSPEFASVFEINKNPRVQVYDASRTSDAYSASDIYPHIIFCDFFPLSLQKAGRNIWRQCQDICVAWLLLSNINKWFHIDNPSLWIEPGFSAELQRYRSFLEIEKKRSDYSVQFDTKMCLLALCTIEQVSTEAWFVLKHQMPPKQCFFSKLCTLYSTLHIQTYFRSFLFFPSKICLRAYFTVVWMQ